jgi:hypothetical protein
LREHLQSQVDQDELETLNALANRAMDLAQLCRFGPMLDGGSLEALMDRGINKSTLRVEVQPLTSKEKI